MDVRTHEEGGPKMSGIADAPWVGKCREDYYDAREREKYCTCDVCGEVIYEGESYYKLNDASICKECVSDAERTARW
jgi:hypothetical protein